MKSLPSERLASAAADAPKSFDLVRDHEAMKEALQLTAGALRSFENASLIPQNIRFTGKWAHLGTMTISEILDRANQALEG